MHKRNLLIQLTTLILLFINFQGKCRICEKDVDGNYRASSSETQGPSTPILKFFSRKAVYRLPPIKRVPPRVCRCTFQKRKSRLCDLPHFCLPCTEAGALRDGEYCHPAFQSRASGKIERISLHRPLPSTRSLPNPRADPARVEGAYSGEKPVETPGR